MFVLLSLLYIRGEEESRVETRDVDWAGPVHMLRWINDFLLACLRSVASSFNRNLSYRLLGRSEAVAIPCVEAGCIRSKSSSPQEIVPHPFSICNNCPVKLCLSKFKRSYRYMPSSFT
jgi:hypothetical protein